MLPQHRTTGVSLSSRVGKDGATFDKIGCGFCSRQYWNRNQKTKPTYVYINIKQLSKGHPSYINDTWDLLDKLKDIKVPSNAILVTADVHSIYTNIQPNKGLEVLRKMYDEYDVSMLFEELNRLLELSLLHNDLVFNDQWFLQTSGTARGKRYAPILPIFSWLIRSIGEWHPCPSGQLLHGPLARYVKLRVRMRRECRERFPRHRRWAIPTCITARASRTCRDACRDRQLAVSFEIGGGGKRSRHSRRMRNLQFYVSGKRPIVYR